MPKSNGNTHRNPKSIKTLNLNVNPIENTQSKLKSSKDTKFKPKS